MPLTLECIQKKKKKGMWRTEGQRDGWRDRPSRVACWWQNLSWTCGCSVSKSYTLTGCLKSFDIKYWEKQVTRRGIVEGPSFCHVSRSWFLNAISK